MLIKIEAANLIWNAKQLETGWVARCEMLRITTMADTWGELVQNIQDSIDGWFRDEVEDGTLDATLQRLGWRRKGDIPSDPYERDQLRVELPWDVQREALAV